MCVLQTYRLTHWPWPDISRVAFASKNWDIIFQVWCILLLKLFSKIITPFAPGFKQNQTFYIILYIIHTLIPLGRTSSTRYTDRQSLSTTHLKSQENMLKIAGFSITPEIEANLRSFQKKYQLEDSELENVVVMILTQENANLLN